MNNTTKETPTVVYDEAEHYFGACSICRAMQYRNLCKQQWGVCMTHKIMWIFGENLLSSWRYETLAEQLATAKSLDGFLVVDDGKCNEYFSYEQAEPEIREFLGNDLTEDLTFADSPEWMKWKPGDQMDGDTVGWNVYSECPLCGSATSIYGGNVWGTTPCCCTDQGGRELERLTAIRLLAGDTEEKVAEVIIRRGVPDTFERSYITHIQRLLTGYWGQLVTTRYMDYLAEGRTVCPESSR